MRKTTCTLLLVILFFSASVSAIYCGIGFVTPKGRGVYLYKDYQALVIGISDYDHWPDLPNAAKDAGEVAAKLEKLDFSVNLAAEIAQLRAERENAQKQLAEMRELLKAKEEAGRQKTVSGKIPSAIKNDEQSAGAQ